MVELVCSYTGFNSCQYCYHDFFFDKSIHRPTCHKQGQGIMMGMGRGIERHRLQTKGYPSCLCWLSLSGFRFSLHAKH